ncbi:hypothetical protein EPI10_005810 [Gossypium australe]|uniref:Uncharacterized protein n=1 Tax=Gossypium australe TaxID=47621 RepID=A0A5B6WPE0_9ROSI|nr:hypothetical protein EPI10_005810 [Gossypium australe]
MYMNSYMWTNECFSYNPKPSMAKAVKENDKYQHILEMLHHLETTVKPSMNNIARSYVFGEAIKVAETRFKIDKALRINHRIFKNLKKDPKETITLVVVKDWIKSMEKVHNVVSALNEMQGQMGTSIPSNTENNP